MTAYFWAHVRYHPDLQISDTNMLTRVIRPSKDDPSDAEGVCLIDFLSVFPPAISKAIAKFIPNEGTRQAASNPWLTENDIRLPRQVLRKNQDVSEVYFLQAWALNSNMMNPRVRMMFFMIS